MRESKKISVLFLCLLVILGSVFYPSAGAYTAAQNIISGEVYYVKNKFSGKYLDVEHGVDANGTNVSQYQYKGAGNQRWRVSYVGGGLYNLTPQISNTRMLDVYNASDFQRANIDIWIDGNQSPARRFALALNTDSYSFRLLSQCSSFTRAVTVEGKSCSNGANVFQFAYNGTANDEWILEPANRKSVELGVNYALCNAAKRPVTYPDCEQLGGDCTNFVSQCMLASGVHFRDEWMINKKSGNYPRPVSAAQLDDSWELKTIGGIFGYGASSPWISAEKFREFWKHKVQIEFFSGEFIRDHSDKIIQKDFVRGDVIQVIDNNEAFHTMYITGYSRYNGQLSYTVTYHSSDNKNRNLLELLKNGSAHGKKFVEFQYCFYKMI